jgi:D-alanyl-D-alanine carboxypeptidase
VSDLKAIYIKLGIPLELLNVNKTYPEVHKNQLVYGGKDKFQRDFYLEEGALNAWNLMCVTAQKDNVILEVVSAYRSIEYQASLIQNKLDKRQIISAILKVNAAPGMSEHHTGRAIDISVSSEDEVLTEAFEETLAFSWLNQNAHNFQFALSFPRGNTLGFDYEPWHWCFQR